MRWAFLGGALASGLLVGFLGYRSYQRLKERGVLFAGALREGASGFELLLLSKGEGMQRELQGYATGLAEDIGHQHMATYGVTPATIARAQRLYERVQRLR